MMPTFQVPRPRYCLERTGLPLCSELRMRLSISPQEHACFQSGGLKRSTHKEFGVVVVRRTDHSTSVRGPRGVIRSRYTVLRLSPTCRAGISSSVNSTLPIGHSSSLLSARLLGTHRHHLDMFSPNHRVSDAAFEKARRDAMDISFHDAIGATILRYQSRSQNANDETAATYSRQFCRFS